MSYIQDLEFADVPENSDVYVLTSGLSSKEMGDIPDGAVFFKPDVLPVILPGDIRETAQGFDSDWFRPSAKTPASHTIEALGSGGGVIAVGRAAFFSGRRSRDGQLQPPRAAPIPRRKIASIRHALGCLRQIVG